MEINFLVECSDTSWGRWSPCLNERSIEISEWGDRILNTVDTAILERNMQIYDEIGAWINVRTRAHLTGLIDYITPLFATGFSDYHVISGSQFFSIDKVLGTGAGRFINFNALTESENQLQLDQPWWDSQRIETLTFDNVSWYITGHLSLSWVASMYVSIINRRLWDDNSAMIGTLTGGLTCIYDIVRAGLWTMDLLIDITNSIFTSLTGEETRRRGDTVGYLSRAGTGSTAGFALSVGAGVPYTTWQNGRPQIGLSDQRAVDFADRIHTLYSDSLSFVANTNSFGEIFEIFREGNALITVGMLQSIELFLVDEGFDDRLHIAPIPKLNAEQANHYTLLHDSVALFSIPIDHFGIIRDITLVLDRMAQLSYEIVYPAFNERTVMRIIDQDYDNVREMLRIARDGVYTCFNVVWVARVGLSLVVQFAGGHRIFAPGFGPLQNWNRNIASLITDLSIAAQTTALNMARARREFIY